MVLYVERVVLVWDRWPEEGCLGARGWWYMTNGAWVLLFQVSVFLFFVV